MLSGFLYPPSRAARAGRGIRSAENQGAKPVYKIGSKAVVLDEKSHVNRAVERIEDQIEIDILTEFATADAPLQSRISFAAAWP